MQPPLDGIRILDFGRVLSAPYGTLNLADLGADVVKVESPRGGDDTRSFGPPFVDDISSYFLSINRGKRSIVLDLKEEGDRNLARRLAGVADVVVENFRPGVMRRLGLGADGLRQENPRLIYASLSGYGQDRGTEPGYDLMMQGLSGIPSITGPVEGAPYKCGASIADLVAGMNLTQGILAALYRRERTGRGGFVDVPMIDGMLSLLTYHASAYLNAGVAPRRMGNGHPSIHPFQPYECTNGYINICIGNDRLFALLSKALAHPEWSEDFRFQSNPLRVEHRRELDELLEPIFLSQSKEYWREHLRGFSIPAELVVSIPEALDGAKKRGRITSHAHPKNPKKKVYTLPRPFSLDGVPDAAKRRAPRLDEHREEVLRDWLS
ncbi:MAG: CoA transferase [Myxococcota bacterium]|nr:CoA transferase [Myxococcota bacterium]